MEEENGKKEVKLKTKQKQNFITSPSLTVFEIEVLSRGNGDGHFKYRRQKGLPVDGISSKEDKKDCQ